MIVDTSAVLAVMFGEPDAERYERAIAGALHCRMSVANFLETAIVLESRNGGAGRDELDLFLDRAPVELVPVTAGHAPGLATVRQREPSGRAELRRLFRLRPCRGCRRAPSL